MRPPNPTVSPHVVVSNLKLKHFDRAATNCVASLWLMAVMLSEYLKWHSDLHEACTRIQALPALQSKVDTYLTNMSFCTICPELIVTTELVQ